MSSEAKYTMKNITLGELLNIFEQIYPIKTTKEFDNLLSGDIAKKSLENIRETNKERNAKIAEYLRYIGKENSSDIRDLKTFAEENNYPEILKYINDLT